MCSNNTFLRNAKRYMRGLVSPVDEEEESSAKNANVLCNSRPCPHN